MGKLRAIFFVFLAVGSVACSVSIPEQTVTPVSMPSTPPSISGPYVAKGPTQGETVTTANGYQFHGDIGEISSSQVTSSGYKFQGAFYE